MIDHFTDQTSHCRELTGFRDVYKQNYDEYIVIIIGRCNTLRPLVPLSYDRVNCIEEHNTNRNFTVEFCHAIT